MSKGSRNRSDLTTLSNNDTSGKCYFCCNKATGKYKGVKACNKHKEAKSGKR